MRPAWAADEFDTLRARWVGFLVGTGYDPAAEPFKTKLADIGAATRGFRETMGPGTGWLWVDLPLGSVSWNITSSFNRLRTMAGAYAMPGTGLTGDAGLATDLRAGLDYLAANAYKATGTRSTTGGTGKSAHHKRCWTSSR